MKSLLIQAIHHLIYNNIFCSDPSSKKWNGIAANGYEKRMIGFRAELEFERLLMGQGREILQGGWLLSRRAQTRCLEDSIYFTICKDNPDQYVELYSLLTRLDFNNLFYIEYVFPNNHDEWQASDVLGVDADIPHPVYTCYEFKNGTFTDVTDGDFGVEPLVGLYSKKGGQKYKAAYTLNAPPLTFANRFLSNFTPEELQNILANRFLFDGLLGFGRKKGIPTDIDLVVLKDGKISLLEIKEKDKAKTVVGFGMDTPRLNDMRTISSHLGIDYYYIVMEVDNQWDRNFKNWWYIDLEDFYQATKDSGTIEGGTGMATATEFNHPTVVAPISHYRLYV